MPLSEHEQHLLDEMERSLYRNDGDFVASVSPVSGRPTYRSMVLGLLLGVTGIAVIVSGVMLQLAILGVVGFVVMFAGVLLAISSPKRSYGHASSGQTSSGQAWPGHDSPGQGSQASNNRPRASFMDRMNQRWDKRQDERGQ